MAFLRRNIRLLTFDQLEEIRQLCVQEMSLIQDTAVDEYNENYAYPFESPVKPDSFSTPVGKKLIFVDLTESDSD
jgi:hypothetical protein